MTKHLLMVGGGSGGHLAPLVAVAQALTTLESDWTIAALCSSREADAEFLRAANIPYEQLSLPGRNLLFPLRWLQAFRKTRAVIRERKPDVLFSKGGAISFPVACACALRRIPIIVHESDAVMGWGAWLVSFLATKICVGFPDGQSRKTICTGHPVRREITRGRREEGLLRTGFSGTSPIVLFMGGSQGAEAINAWVIRKRDELLRAYDVIHLTGPGKSAAPAVSGYRSLPFAHGEELAHLYAAADVAVSRAGAGSIAELRANHIPTILIPLAGLAQNHQVHNAAKAVLSGNFIALDQWEMDARLLPAIAALLRTRAEPKGKMRPLAEALRTNAALRIAKILVESVAR